MIFPFPNVRTKTIPATTINNFFAHHHAHHRQARTDVLRPIFIDNTAKATVISRIVGELHRLRLANINQPYVQRHYLQSLSRSSSFSVTAPRLFYEWSPPGSPRINHKRVDSSPFSHDANANQPCWHLTQIHRSLPQSISLFQTRKRPHVQRCSDYLRS